MKVLAQRLVVILASVLAVSCAADRIHREGLDAFEHGDYEQSIAKLGEAVKAEPDNLEYRLDLRARRDAAIQELIAAADRARTGGHADAAEAGYRRVLGLEPGNDRARRGLEGVQADRRHAERTASAERLLAAKQFDAAETEVRAVLAEDPGFAAATALAAKIDTARGPVTVSPRLRTADNRPVTLQFRDAPTKMVFEVLARQTGVNFIFDKDVKSETKTTIFVTNVPVEQAIELILTQNQLARQVLSENMVLVYPNTAAKQKDYQDEIVRTFYLANAAPKDAESMLKTVLGAKTLFIDERSATIVIRDTPEHVRMAEKLIASIDVSDPEVMLEIEVLELTRSNLQTLGINYPTGVSATMGPTPPGPGAVGTSGATGTTGLVFNDLAHQNGYTIGVSSLGLSVDLLKQIDQTNVLASPRVRVRNKEKAKVMIGDRVPVITSGTTATVGGAYSTSAVQYIEVGLTLDVQPTIHLDGNVAIKMGLEVSSITKEVDVKNPDGKTNSTVAYQIGTRNTNTTLELRDGETQVLAGLIQDQDTRNSNHIPGLGDLPILGRLFGSRTNQTDKTEIVLSITPRVIRSQTRPSSETTEFWYGTESQTRMAPFSSSGSGAGPSAGPVVPGGVSFAGGGPAAAPGVGAAPRQAPARLESAVAAPPPEAAASAASASGSGAETAAPAAAAAGTRKAAVTIEGPDSAKVGDEFSVAVRLAADRAIGKVLAQVRFDASALQLVGTDPGDLVAGGEAPKVDLKPGGVQVEIAGSPDNALAGAGTIMNLRFKAVAPRPAVPVATQVVLVGADGVAIAASPAVPLKVAITQ